MQIMLVWPDFASHKLAVVRFWPLTIVADRQVQMRRASLGCLSYLLGLLHADAQHLARQGGRQDTANGIAQVGVASLEG